MNPLDKGTKKTTKQEQPLRHDMADKYKQKPQYKTEASR
jgi:hypothetical protein